MRLVGIDGCRGGWVMATAVPHLAFYVLPDLKQIGAEARRGTLMAVVDIPIGLPDSGARECDVAARQILKERASSVFPAPSRAALKGWQDYERACHLNERASGKRLSKQAFAILPKIRDVDRLMTVELQERVREAHPEVSFARLAGHPMRHHKAKREGRAERLALLNAHGISFDPTWERQWLGASKVAEDDLIDAAVCLVTARRIVEGNAQVLPSENVERDANGLRMEMVA